MRRIIAVLVVVAVAAGIGFLFRDRLTGNAGDLQVGDCFMVPAGDTVNDVQHHPCAEAHDGEVFVVDKYSGTDTYPSTDDFDAWAAQYCGPAFQTYTGDSYDTRNDLSIGYFYPLEDGWGKGDRQMICYLTPLPEGTTVTVSYKKAGN
jgi:hypothetical protein